MPLLEPNLKVVPYGTPNKWKMEARKWLIVNYFRQCFVDTTDFMAEVRTPPKFGSLSMEIIKTSGI